MPLYLSAPGISTFVCNISRVLTVSKGYRSSNSDTPANAPAENWHQKGSAEGQITVVSGYLFYCLDGRDSRFLCCTVVDMMCYVVVKGGSEVREGCKGPLSLLSSQVVDEGIDPIFSSDRPHYSSSDLTGQEREPRFA
jgi:hypothetical protein